MPICIECGYRLANLYTTYSKADDRSLGKGVRLAQCPRCKRFADKYVEHDYVVIFIDLVLIKPQVYRHLLFNRLGREDDKFNPAIVRLGVLLLLFDVYLTWARIEKATSSAATASPDPPTRPLSPANLTSNATPLTINPPPDNLAFSTFLSQKSIFLQYVFFLTLCASETAAFHLPIRFLLSAFPPPAAAENTAASNRDRWIPFYPQGALLSTALIVSSFTKLFPLLLLIWSYDLPSSASAVSWAVIVNNVAALDILLDCGAFRAIILAAVGAVCRGVVGWVVLRAVGVQGRSAIAGVVETGDLVEVAGKVAGILGLG